MTTPTGYFALDKLAGFECFCGYVVDSGMYLYSIKRKGAPHLMASTHGVIKLAGSITQGQAARSVTIEQIRDACNRSHSFQVWKNESTQTESVAVSPNVQAWNTLIKSGWIIGTMGVNGLEFSKEPKVHETLISVRIECARIAKLVPGVQVVYLEVKGSCVAGSVTWA